jgi:phosphatidylethanolamine/phosphatidyl-N-methylethanolamine N-methyltransferase
MLQANRFRPQSDNRFAFLQGFLERPREVGSIVPSSRFLERRVVRCADVGNAKVIVELGPGTGGTTRALLRAMNPSARLLSLEVNPRFVTLLQKMRDPRFIVHRGSAADIGKALERYGLGSPDLVLSGIPFSTMTPAVGTKILKSVYDVLEPGGRFVAYQVRDRVENLGREVFGRARVQTELLNVPPMRVYRWDK